MNHIRGRILALGAIALCMLFVGVAYELKATRVPDEMLPGYDTASAEAPVADGAGPTPAAESPDQKDTATVPIESQTTSNQGQVRTELNTATLFTGMNQPKQPESIQNAVTYGTEQPHRWGVYAGDNVGDLARFESLVGHTANLSAYFVAFGDAFPKTIVQSLKGSTKTFVVFWEPQGSLDDIIAGKWDDYMRAFTRDAIEYGDPILIAPFHEMNLVDSPWSGVRPGNSAEKLVLAWRHTHDVVMSQGPRNITWGWAVNQEPNPDTPENDIAAYYPGDAYVDVVGVDGFNFAKPWQDFESLFGDMLLRLRRYGKPIYVFSIASAPGSDKPAWITDALSTQMARYNVVAWIWFNSNKEKDWRVNSSPESLEAFKAAISIIR